MRIHRRLILGAVAAAALLVGTVANALPTGLALGIDGSSSISASNFQLQRDAYASVLGSLVPTDGSVAIGVWQFSSNVQQEFALTLIDSQTAKDNLVSAVLGMTQLNQGTAIGTAIDTAAAALIGYGLSNLDKSLIDISTDGINTVGGSPVTAANNAVAAGIDQVNCLGVGGSANCGFIAGTGSFAVAANSFADFEAALETKIGKEINGVIPEPGAVSLFGVSALVLGLASRRRRSD